ncbi:MAG: sulfite exporter TauE/SafE family protein [Thermoleophilia bacterium]|nr:sulfite exporter TauE/SafE family protein [Thermoleophilia bacterium]
MHFDIGDVTGYQWVLAVISGMVIGMSKAGLNGLTLMFIPLMALAFGSKASTGILLPMLCVGDIFAVAWYRRHAEWRYLLKLLPSAVVGIGVGATVGVGLSDDSFRFLLGAIIMALLALTVWLDIRKKENAYPKSWWFGVGAGLAAGFTTMVGNAAGAITNIYLLSMRLPKNAFIGTAAWFFFIVNLVKVPLQAFVWKNMSGMSLVFDAIMIPAIAVGAAIGIVAAGKIPERAYRIFVMVMTGVAGVLLFFV